MKLPLLALVLLLACAVNTTAVAGVPAVPVRDKWALIVGIAQFQDSAIKPLAYSVKSARELAGIFEDPDVGHFNFGHVRLLLNDNATKYGIEHVAIDGWLFRKALPNDLIVVYIATRMIEDETHHSWYLCASDSIASDIEATGVPLEVLLKNLKERTQSRRILCVLDAAPQTKLGSLSHNPLNSESLLQLVNHSGVSLLCAGVAENSTIITGAQPDKDTTYAATDSPLVHFLCESIKTTQGSASLHSSSQYISRNLPVPNTVMYLASDNELLAAIPLGLPIKSTSAIENLHFGHPVDTLALDRPDLDQKINTHNIENTNNEEGGSFSQVEFDNYLNRMKKCIQTKWQPPEGFEDRSVATMFTIAKDGTIADASVVTSSGSDDVDSSALSALKAASPLEPLPPGSGESVRIRYKFNWHVKPSK